LILLIFLEVTVNITLGTPYVLIPSGKNNFKSKEHIFIDFGKISLVTTFPKEKECSRYLINMEKFQILAREQLDANSEALTETRFLSGI
jgi:hypothetical protein